VILERTTVGVMHESIIAHLLEKSRRLLAVWRQSRVTEAADFQDLVEAGIVTRAIHLHELRQVILASLRGQFENDRNETTPVNSSGGDLRQA
jgi:methyl coenzyme M reductase subunit C